MLRFLPGPVLIAGLLLASPLHAAAPAFFFNPLFNGGDPWVTRVDGVYYYAASNCGIADICIKRSAALSGLARAPWIGVWDRARSNDPNGSEIWAPELHHLDGRWYLYYAADDGNNDHHRLFVLVANRPEGPFEEAKTGQPHGRLAESTDHWAIDPDVFTAADGHRYLTWSCTDYPDARFPQRICLAPLRDPLHVAGPTVFLSTPAAPWEVRGKPIQEGPVGYTRAGRSYITYSASASWIPNDYAVGLLALASGASPLRPSAWAKSGPIFDHNGRVYGPGSVVFVPSPDGRQWWNVYHAIERLDCNPAYRCRDIRMQPMRFDDHGAPLLGRPVEAGVPLALPSGDADAAAGERRHVPACPNYSPVLPPEADGSGILELASDYLNGGCITCFARMPWNRLPAAGSTWALRGVFAPSPCLGNSGWSTADNTAAELWTCNDLSLQRWAFHAQGDGFFSLRNQATGLCLDNAGGSTMPGNLVTTHAVDPRPR